MIAIFIISSIPEMELSQITDPAFATANEITAHYTPILIDWYKVGHVIGYACLGLSLLIPFKLSVKRPILITLLVTVFYASLDEFHQRFVPGRHSSLEDILLDLSAATVAILIYQIYRTARNRKTPQENPLAE